MIGRRMRACVLATAVVLASTGCATLVEVSRGGTDHPTGHSFLEDSPSAPSVSGDGRYSVFTGPRAANDATSEVFRHDAQTGDTVRVSSDAHGDPVGGRGPAISRDGRYVAFVTAATLVPADVNLDPTSGWTGADVYVRDLETGAYSLVSLDPSGGPFVTGGLDSLPSTIFMSADARYVAFAKESFQGRTSFSAFSVRDRQAAAPVAIGSGYGALAGMSGDGMHVSIDDFTPCTTICPSPAGGRVIDWKAGGSFTIDCGAGGRMPMSDDGRYVATRQSGADGCQEGIVRYDRAAPGTVTPLATSIPSTGALSSLTMDSTASIVAFSTPLALIPSDRNGFGDVYVGRIGPEPVQIASRGPLDAPGDGDSVGPGLSADGRYVVFSTSASNLLADDTDGQPDVVLVDALRPEITSISPTMVARGTTNTVVTVTGAGFAAAAQVVVLGDGVSFGTPTVVNGSQARFRISVAANATPGPRDLLVTTLGHWANAAGWCFGCLRIT
jgi:hypothetical protein